MPAEHEVFGRLGRTRAGIDVGHMKLGRLLRDELASVFGLRYQLVRPARIYNDVGTGQRQLCRWRIGRPQVFADLDADSQVAQHEDLVPVESERLQPR
jgi:hypothetical protein